MTRNLDDIKTMSVIHRSIVLLPMHGSKTIEVREQPITLPLVSALLLPVTSQEVH